MLVLNRKRSEAVLIDGCIEVRVLDVSGSRVRLGIVAPPNVAILRGELVRHNGQPSESRELFQTIEPLVPTNSRMLLGESQCFR